MVKILGLAMPMHASTFPSDFNFQQGSLCPLLTLPM